MYKTDQIGSRLAGYGMAVAATLAVLATTGCGNGLGEAKSAGPLSTTFNLSGKVHGGQQAITGASIQLYAVGTAGVASASTPLIPTASIPLSDANGAFGITGTYSCTGATQVYLVATSGNSGSGVNTAISEMAALGSCASLQTTTSIIQVNEVTTVAAAYALAPFMTDYKHVGANGSNPTGLLTAFSNANLLASTASGASPGAGLATGVTVPAAEINTLANIIAACVNTSSPTSTACASLFGATSATETIGALIAIAKNPGSAAITSLYTLSTANAPFQPTLPQAPSDFTVALNYSAAGTMNAPYGIAIDAGGNAWVSNSGSAAVTKLSSAGSLLSNYTGGGLVGGKGIAIDRAGNVWVTNTLKNSIVEFNSSGVLVSGTTGYVAGGLNGPVAVALDSAGNAWIANQNANSVVELSSAGTPTAASGANGITAGGTVSIPAGIAIDASGNVLVANNGNGNVVKLTNAGAAATGSPFTDLALQGTTAVAVDGSGNVWATGATTGAAVSGAVSQFSSAGVAATYSPLAGGGLALPSGVATSGATTWVTNNATTGSLSSLVLNSAAAASPAAGFGVLNAPVGVAVDNAGSVWTANSGDNTVSVFIGLTAPVVTPLAATVGP